MVLIYNFCFVLFLTIFVFPYCKNKKSKDIFMVFCFVPSFLIHSLVDVRSVTDLTGYQTAFNSIIGTPLFESFAAYTDGIIGIEPGYMFLFKLISLIYPSFRFFLFFYSFVILTIYFILIRKYSDHYAISILMLLLGPYNQSIFVIRQHLLVPLLLYFGFSLIVNKKQFKFLVFVGLCSFIHVSSLLYIIVYYLYHMRKTRAFLFSIIAISFVMGGGLMLLPQFVERAGYGAYLESGDFNSKTAMLWAFYIILSILILKKSMFNYGIYRYVFVLSLLALFISLVGIGFTPSGRILLYYTPIQILLIPILYRSIKEASARFAYITIVIIINYYITFVGSSWEFLKNYSMISL